MRSSSPTPILTLAQPKDQSPLTRLFPIREPAYRYAVATRAGSATLKRCTSRNSFSWEALLLNARGRVRLPLNLAEWLAEATAPLREASFTHEIVLLAQQLPLPHRDPADRLLAATAQLMNLTLVIADDKLLGMGTIRIMKN